MWQRKTKVFLAVNFFLQTNTNVKKSLGLDNFLAKDVKTHVKKYKILYVYNGNKTKIKKELLNDDPAAPRMTTCYWPLTKSLNRMRLLVCSH